MKMVFVASIIRHKLCIIYAFLIFFVFKNYFWQNIIFLFLWLIWLPGVHCILVLLDIRKSIIVKPPAFKRLLILWALVLFSVVVSSLMLCLLIMSKLLCIHLHCTHLQAYIYSSLVCSLYILTLLMFTLLILSFLHFDSYSFDCSFSMSS